MVRTVKYPWTVKERQDVGARLMQLRLIKRGELAGVEELQFRVLQNEVSVKEALDSLTLLAGPNLISVPGALGAARELSKHLDPYFQLSKDWEEQVMAIIFKHCGSSEAEEKSDAAMESVTTTPTEKCVLDEPLMHGPQPYRWCATHHRLMLSCERRRRAKT